MTEFGANGVQRLTDTPWTGADLVALDLEGSGAQDHDDEAILEIAAVPLVAGSPDAEQAYCTLINPGRPIPVRPWTSPGLTTPVLSRAPRLHEVEPELARRLNGKIIVGHNVGVDWRLLHRRLPDIAPVGLLDTFRLARNLKLGPKLSLTALLDRLNLTAKVQQFAAGSLPHRALWDTIGVGLLLPALVNAGWPHGISATNLLAVGSIDLHPPSTAHAAGRQPSLFDD